MLTVDDWKNNKRKRLIEEVLFNPDSQEPKVKVFLTSYLPLKTEKCSKRGHIIAEVKRANSYYKE